MTENQKIALKYLESIGSYQDFNPVDFFLMVQDTALTIQECSIALDELEQMKILKTKLGKKITMFKLR